MKIKEDIHELTQVSFNIGAITLGAIFMILNIIKGWKTETWFGNMMAIMCCLVFLLLAIISVNRKRELLKVIEKALSLDNTLLATKEKNQHI